MSNDYEFLECDCPACGHYPLHTKRCDQCFGDGYFDESDEDYLLPGTVLVTCEECKGTTQIIWCPNCGTDLTGQNLNDDE